MREILFMKMDATTHGDDYTQKTTLGFVKPESEGLVVEENTCSAPLGHAAKTYGGVIGKSICSSGVISYGFSVKSSAANAGNVTSTEIAVGVIDAAASGQAYGFHIGKSKLTKSSNGQRLKSTAYKSLHAETPRRLTSDAEGRISVLAVVDMTTRRLAIAINEKTPVDTGYTLPASVRPWVWLGGPGVGSVTLTEFKIVAAPPSTRGLAAPRTRFEKTHLTKSDTTTGSTSAAPVLDISALQLDISDPAPNAAPSKGILKGLSLPPRGDASETASESAASSEESEPAEWTARASAWLQPLQQMFVKENDEVRQIL